MRQRISALAANGLIVAGGANAALEAHNLDLAKQWLDRATGAMNDNPQVMRERQRYLTWTGGYQEAADLGSKVIERLPRDPQAPVYLAYDLYYLGRYDEALALATKYDPILPNNRDLALIEGYVHARAGLHIRKRWTTSRERWNGIRRWRPGMPTAGSCGTISASQNRPCRTSRLPSNSARTMAKRILAWHIPICNLHRPQASA